MSGKLKLFSEIKAEHAHDGLSVNGVAAGFEFDIKIVFARNSDEFLEICDSKKMDLYYGDGFHNFYLHGFFINTILSL